MASHAHHMALFIFSSFKRENRLDIWHEHADLDALILLLETELQKAVAVATIRIIEQARFHYLFVCGVVHCVCAVLVFSTVLKYVHMYIISFITSANKKLKHKVY